MKTLSTIITAATLTLVFCTTAQAGNYFSSKPKGANHHHPQRETYAVYPPYPDPNQIGYYHPGDVYMPNNAYFMGNRGRDNPNVPRSSRRYRRPWPEPVVHYHFDGGRRIHCTTKHPPEFGPFPTYGGRPLISRPHQHPHH